MCLLYRSNILQFSGQIVLGMLVLKVLPLEGEIKNVYKTSEMRKNHVKFMTYHWILLICLHIGHARFTNATLNVESFLCGSFLIRKAMSLRKICKFLKYPFFFMTFQSYGCFLRFCILFGRLLLRLDLLLSSSHF